MRDPAFKVDEIAQENRGALENSDETFEISSVDVGNPIRECLVRNRTTLPTPKMIKRKISKHKNRKFFS